MNNITDAGEVWKPVVGYEGLYEVSNIGRVRSLPRTVPHPACGSITRRGKMLTAVIAGTGYPVVGLSQLGKKRWSLVHQLVAAAFIGPRPDGYYTRHLDGTRNNNRVENLAYGTPTDNNRDKIRHGTSKWLQLATHCARGHEYTPDNTRTVRGSRLCIECARARGRRYKARQRLTAP